MSSSIDQTCINSIRCLGAALPQRANSGHPGAPMGCAPIAHCLWGYAMKYSPKNPKWPCRDRFVLSNGHACALHYVMLHLCGYDVTMDDLKAFRQLKSKCPGHPENFHTQGIEVTTGPLGQGIAQAVGLAAAAHHFAAKYNKPQAELFDNFIYTIVGDGCLQEGVASEACSLAGTLGLGRLIALYDSNGITIDGSTSLSFTEDVAIRFSAYGWEVMEVRDGDNDFESIAVSLQKAKQNLSKPTLIIVKTTIGFGSLKQGSEKTHGAPLGVDDIQQFRQKLGFSDDMFDFPQEAVNFYRQRAAAGDALCEAWEKQFAMYKTQYPLEAACLERRWNLAVPADVLSKLPTFTSSDKGDSTRSLSRAALNSLAPHLPEIMGGSADLTHSNLCELKGELDFNQAHPDGRYIRFGVREHGMAAIANGLFAFGGIRPFGATFLNFVTYAWGAVRLSALSQLGVLYIATHDSIELGEDGPTHQPVEVAALCRATPNLHYIRPADGNEVSGAYASWLKNPGTPSVLALCRTAVPHLEGSSLEGVSKGAYVLDDWSADSKGRKVIIGSCGSEVHLCVAAKPLLTAQGFNVRIVSMPCWNLFLQQPKEYQHSVLPTRRGGPASDVAASLYVEAAVTSGCELFFDGSLGMTTFGASAPKKDVLEFFGFTKENIAKQVQMIVDARK